MLVAGDDEDRGRRVGEALLDARDGGDAQVGKLFDAEVE